MLDEIKAVWRERKVYLRNTYFEDFIWELFSGPVVFSGSVKRNAVNGCLEFSNKEY